MAIEVFPSGVNHVDAKGHRYGVINAYTHSLAGSPDISLTVDDFQISHPSIRGEGIPVSKLQLLQALESIGKPYELSIDSMSGFNNDAPCADKDGYHEHPDYMEIRGRYRDMAAALERTLVGAGFSVKRLEHRLQEQWPCHSIQFSPKADADKWSVARVLRLLSEEGFIPRDIAREALKSVPAEKAKLLESGNLAAAYRMVAEARGVSVESLMEHLGLLSADQPTRALAPR